LSKTRLRKLALNLDDWTMDRGRKKASWWWRPELEKTEAPKTKKKKKSRKRR